jgi:hypothetical protein
VHISANELRVFIVLLLNYYVLCCYRIIMCYKLYNMLITHSVYYAIEFPSKFHQNLIFGQYPPVLQIFIAIHLIVFELLKANTFTETQTCTHIHIQTRWKHNLIPTEVFNKQVCMQQIEIRNSLQFVGSITNDIEWKWVHALRWLSFRVLILCWYSNWTPENGTNAELTKVITLSLHLLELTNPPFYLSYVPFS